MNQLSIINPIFEKRIRNHISVTRHAVSDEGAVKLAVPDAYETRLYRLMLITPLSGAEELGSFSVEKTSHADLSPDGKTLVAATVDDMYVFRDWQKRRFFPNSRANYLDVSLSASGEYFAVGLADMIASSHSVALTRTTGAQVWVKSFPHNITSISVSDDASCILVGSDEGLAVMLDSARKVLWKLECGDPVIFVATSATGEKSLLCTRSGVVHGVGREGNRLWDVQGVGAITGCAMSREGDLIAIARTLHDGSGMLGISSGDGTPVLDYYLDHKIKSVACSPNGRFIALSCENGSFTILEICQALSNAVPVDRIKSIYDDGCTSFECGDHATAVRKFSEVLDLSPCHLEACRKLVPARDALMQRYYTEAERLASEGDIARAGEQIRMALSESLCDLDAFEKFSLLREKIASAGMESARLSSSADELEEADREIRAILQFDPTNLNARELLGEFQERLISQYLADADTSMKEDDPQNTVDSLRKVLALRSDPAIDEMLAKAHSLVAMKEGMALYEEKSYSEALVYFRKAVLFDPTNVVAERYIDYAGNLKHDDTLFDRFSKLE